MNYLKKLLAALIFLFSVSQISAQKLKFPEDFALGESFFPGYQLKTIDEKFKKQSSLEKNTAVMSEGKAFNEMLSDGFKQESKVKVKRAYAEVYNMPETKSPKAGLFVF